MDCKKMPSNYIPMVSSSPPPLDDGPSFEDEDDDDDEFGSFATAEFTNCSSIIDHHPYNPSSSSANIDSNSVKTHSPVDASHHCKMNGSKTDDSDAAEDEETATDDFADFQSHDDNKTSTKVIGEDFRTSEYCEILTNLDSDAAIFVVSNESTLRQKSDDTLSMINVTPEPVSDHEECESAVKHLDLDIRCKVTEEEEEAKESSSPRIQQTDSTSQDSVTDSGLCTSSQTSDISNRHEDMFVMDNSCEVVDLQQSCICSVEHYGEMVVTDACSDRVPSLHDSETKTFGCFVEPLSRTADFTINNHSSNTITDCQLSADSQIHYSNKVEDTALTDIDDDDFADVQAAGFAEDSTITGNQSWTIDSSSQDVWQQLEQPVDTHGANVSANFATFSDVDDVEPFQAFQYCENKFDDDAGDDYGEFGNFDSAQPSFSAEPEAFDSNFGTSGVDEVLSMAFPKSQADSLITEVEIEDLEEALIKPPSLERSEANTSSSKCIWSQLCDIDNTHALTYHWSSSQANRKLLRALRINSQNLLAGTRWGSSIPLFAATLGSDPLEPTKAQPKTTDDENTIVRCSLPATNSCSQESTIPPAQFDWSTSGLVNPLDDSTSALLDLDFFLTNDAPTSSSFSSAKLTSLESEFLGNETLSLDKRSTSLLQTKPSSPLLDKILLDAAKSVTFNQIRCRPANLSQEAQQILDSLPDLSFMQAKVLMFPIRDTVVESSQ